MERQKILLVDDDPRNLQLLRQILKDEYALLYAKSGAEAITNAMKYNPDLILLDVMMPEMDGYRVCEILKGDRRCNHIPIIFVTALNDEAEEARGFELGAVDFISKPVRPSVVRHRVRSHLALSDQQRACQRRIEDQQDELRRTRLESLMMLGKAAEYRDNETGLHVQRMARYSELLADAYGWNSSACDLILHAAPMHDIGKIGIPDRILQKPGPLTPDEWVIMRQHTEIGAEIIGQFGGGSELFVMARSIALSHHEKWNGSGYPLGLKGEAIPIEGRIVALADVFDALTTRRPYKEAWPLEKAIVLLQDEAGEHFDPTLSELFIERMPQVRKIMDQWQEL